MGPARVLPGAKSHKSERVGLRSRCRVRPGATPPARLDPRPAPHYWDCLRARPLVASSRACRLFKFIIFYKSSSLTYVMHREDLVLAPARAGSVAGPHDTPTATGATYLHGLRTGRVGVWRCGAREPRADGPEHGCHCRASCKFDVVTMTAYLLRRTVFKPCYEATSEGALVTGLRSTLKDLPQ